MSYNFNSSDPFSQNNNSIGNNLILKDSALRHRSGAYTLDSNVSDVYNLQRGGGAKGAPFTTNTGPKWYQFGGNPNKFYDNTKKW